MNHRHERGGISLQFLAILGVALAAAAALIWILSLEPGGAPRESAELERSAARNSAGETPREEGGSPRRSTPAAGSSELHPSAGGLRIRVLAEEAALPVRDAEVLWCDLGELDPGDVEASRTAWRRSPLQWLRARGRAARTDIRGEVVLPVSKTALRLVVHQGALLGSYQSEPGQRGTHTLLLFAGKRLRVQVVGPSGEPLADIPLAARAERLLARGTTTAPRGLAELRLRGEFAPGLRARVVPLLLIDPLPEGSFAPADPPPEPLRIALPPTGAIEISARGPDGELLAEEATVRLLPAGDLPPQSPWRDTPFLVNLERGRARVELIGLGQSLQASLRVPASNLSVTQSFAGPRAPGEVVELELRARGMVLHARALDSAGTLLARRLLACRIGPQERRWVATDAEGRLRITLGESVQNLEKLRLVLELKEVGTPARQPFLDTGGTRLEVDLSSASREGELDLGDLVFPLEPILVAGIVRDGAGQPVEGARITVHLQPPGGRQRLHARLISDAQGRFVARGTPGEAAIHLLASKPPLGSAERGAIPPESTGIELVLGRRGRLIGRLAEGAIDLPQDVRIELARGAEIVKSARVSPNGTFFIALIPAGSYELRAMVGSSTLARVPAVKVAPGETTHDPRLLPLALTGEVRALRLRLLDPQGPCVRLAVKVYSGAEPPELLAEKVTDAKGRLAAAVPAGTRFAWIAPATHRPQRVEWLPYERDLQLAPQPRIQLRFDPNLRLPRESLRIALKILATGAQPPLTGVREIRRIARLAPLDLALPLPGAYRIEWSLLDGSARRAQQPSSRSAGTIQVAEGATLQTFDLPITQDDLDAAASGLARPPGEGR